MTKRKAMGLFSLLLAVGILLLTVGMDRTEDGTLPVWVNAADYGLAPDNDPVENSRILQQLVQQMSRQGGTIHIPAGSYPFGELGQQTIGSHCVRMYSNVAITGDGAATVLRPVGVTEQGLDMFYFNDYRDLGQPNYLENCRFSDFVIDGSGTACRTYTSAGKGFMFDLFRNCHWNRVTVRDTDATGFGVDSPVDSSMVDCIAIGCGKAATVSSPGAAGFGIGFGFAPEENLRISGCAAYHNKKFGFFFEHQGRFNPERYTAEAVAGFVVEDCTARGNYDNFGGLMAADVVYQDCFSAGAMRHGYCFDNSRRCQVTGCTSRDEGASAFAILQTDAAYPVTGVCYTACTANGAACGVQICGSGQNMTGNTVTGCRFRNLADHTVCTAGSVGQLTLTDNIADLPALDLQGQTTALTETGNSWNVPAH